MESFEARFQNRKGTEYSIEFYLDHQEFNRTNLEIQTEIDIDRTTPVVFDPISSQLQTEVRQSHESPEALWEAEESTLVVLPPMPGSGTLTPEDLAQMALPVIGFINSTQPDIVIGCDRGGRMFSLATYNMWHKHIGTRFPTMDGKLHYRRLSTSYDQGIVESAIQDAIRASVIEARRQGNGVHQPLRLLFIDDWVASGATKRYILETLQELHRQGYLPEYRAMFALMCGDGGNVSGSNTAHEVPWHDNPTLIGVNYGRDGRGFATRTHASLSIRERIYAANSELANQLHKKSRKRSRR